ncbi:MAG: serine hydrolase [Tannerella sp.]|jgi:beta-glucosidase-like glycosyl hydrolase/CubicO group peptidase (beta-lactamase class C family)|nr:serine hydrolase [Tannerella sp.]
MNKIETRLILSVLSFYLCLLMQAQTTPTLYAETNQKAMRQWVDSVYESMSDDERIGQFFMVSAPTNADSKNVADLVSLVKNSKVGGVIFFKGKPETQLLITNRLQREAKTPLLIGIDGEWGLSMRLSNTTRFPKNMMLGAVQDIKLIERYGEEVGRQCREMGIHVNFAPVLDVNSNVNNPVIGIRSFGEEPEDVARKAAAYSRGLEKAGVISVAKHFPGHGDTNNDSHYSLPTIDHDLKRLKNTELYPFSRYIKGGFSGIMVAHLNIPALRTEGRPGSLSYSVVTELLRDEMGFRGLCFTDGLAMKGAVAGENESVCVLALKAGNDILVGPVDPVKEINAVKQAVKAKKLNMADLEKRCRRILAYKYIAGLNRKPSLSTRALPERLNTPQAALIDAKLNEEAITLVKNDDDFIPLKHLDGKRIAALSLGGKADNIFQETLQKYCKTDCYNISPKTEAVRRKEIYDRLRKADLIICSVHSADARESAELRNIAKTNDLIYVFFTVPYKCAGFAESLVSAKAVVVGYEDTELSEKFAAQAVYGGIAVKGALPVSIPGMYTVGTGIETAKIRLGYHVPEEVNLSSYKLHEIDSIVKEGLDKEAYPGCRVLVAKDGMIVYDKAFGYYDYTKTNKVTWKTVYDLASITKATGTLLSVMKSYDEGNFELNDRISDYLTDLKQSDKKNLIIKEMLYHQSGLPPVINFFEQAIDRNSYTGSLYSRKRDNLHPYRYDAQNYVNNTFKFNASDVSHVKKKGFNAEAGRDFYVSDVFVKDSIIEGVKRARLGASGRYTYSCVNFILLKLMIERQTGITIDKYLNDNFLNPLGASSMTYNPLKKMDISLIAPTEDDHFTRRQLIRGYVHDEAAAFQGGVSGNAGLFSNAEDLAKIAQLYLNNGIYGGERLISTKTCKLFTGSKSPTCRRGLGFDKPDTQNISRSPCGKNAPASVYGHTGFTGTCFWIDPDNNLIFIFLSNRTYPSRTNAKLFSLDIRTKIQDCIYEAIR